MIIRSSKGTSIDGALRYVEGPGRGGQAPDRSTLLGGGGFGFEPNEETVDTAKRLMIQNGSRKFQGEKDRYCDKDCLHLSASWDPAQQPPDLEEKLDTARRALKALGMEDSMHLIYDHSDKEHPHIHVIGSRLNPNTGKAYDDYKRVEKLIKFGLDKEREDAISGKRPIPQAKRHLHGPQLDQPQKIDLSLEDRLAAIRKLYGAHKEEQHNRYLSKRAIDGLYKAQAREKEERQMIDDGIGGRWAKGLSDYWLKHHEERLDQERYAAKEKERERGMRQDNDQWMKQLIDIWSKNRERAQSVEPEPKGSIVDRLMDRADKALGGEAEREPELPQEPKQRFDDALDKVIDVVDRFKPSKMLDKESSIEL